MADETSNGLKLVPDDWVPDPGDDAPPLVVGYGSPDGYKFQPLTGEETHAELVDRVKRQSIVIREMAEEYQRAIDETNGVMERYWAGELIPAPQVPAKDIDPEDDAALLADFERTNRLLRDRVRLVANRHHPGMYLYGRAGIGKTYTVTKTLEELGKFEEQFHIKGRVSASELVDRMQANPNAVFVLDDVPDLIREAKGVIMAATDGQGGQPSWVTWAVKGKKDSEPIAFWFYGGVIVISNKSLDSKDPVIAALASRMPPFKFEPTDAQVEVVIRDMAKRDFEGVSAEKRNQVVEYVIEQCRKSNYLLTRRAYTQGCECVVFAETHPDAESHWMELIDTMLQQMNAEMRGPALSDKRTEMSEQEQYAGEVYATLKGRAERLAKWQERYPGSSYDTMHRSAKRFADKQAGK